MIKNHWNSTVHRKIKSSGNASSRRNNNENTGNAHKSRTRPNSRTRKKAATKADPVEQPKAQAGEQGEQQVAWSNPEVSSILDQGMLIFSGDIDGNMGLATAETFADLSIPSATAQGNIQSVMTKLGESPARVASGIFSMNSPSRSPSILRKRRRTPLNFKDAIANFPTPQRSLRSGDIIDMLSMKSPSPKSGGCFSPSMFFNGTVSPRGEPSPAMRGRSKSNLCNIFAQSPQVKGLNPRGAASFFNTVQPSPLRVQTALNFPSPTKRRKLVTEETLHEEGEASTPVGERPDSIMQEVDSCSRAAAEQELRREVTSIPAAALPKPDIPCEDEPCEGSDSGANAPPAPSAVVPRTVGKKAAPKMEGGREFTIAAPYVVSMYMRGEGQGTFGTGLDKQLSAINNKMMDARNSLSPAGRMGEASPVTRGIMSVMGTPDIFSTAPARAMASQAHLFLGSDNK